MPKVIGARATVGRVRSRKVERPIYNNLPDDDVSDPSISTMIVRNIGARLGVYLGFSFV